MKEKVYEALQTMRPPFVPYEMDLHDLVGESFQKAELPFLHEVVIGAGCRIDYLVGDVGVEIKKGKPQPAKLLQQLQRYAASDRISVLIVVSQRSVRVPKKIDGKPVMLLVLSQLWGVALP